MGPKARQWKGSHFVVLRENYGPAGKVLICWTTPHGELLPDKRKNLASQTTLLAKTTLAKERKGKWFLLLYIVLKMSIIYRHWKNGGESPISGTNGCLEPN